MPDYSIAYRFRGHDGVLRERSKPVSGVSGADAIGKLYQRHPEVIGIVEITLAPEALSPAMLAVEDVAADLAHTCPLQVFLGAAREPVLEMLGSSR